MSAGNVRFILGLRQLLLQCDIYNSTVRILYEAPFRVECMYVTAVPTPAVPIAALKGWSASYARLGPHTVIMFLTAERLRKYAGLQSL